MKPLEAATASAVSTQAMATPNRQVQVLCVLFFFSGFPALIYQLVWQRALFRIFGVNIESVTVVVTAFMLGLGMGSLAGGWLSKHRRMPILLLLAVIETLTGLFGFWSLSIFESVGELVLGAPLPLVSLVTLGLVVVPTLLMGATLPLLVAYLVQRSGNVGDSVGKLYYVNTLGAGAACLACAVALFPFFGMLGSVLVAVAFNAAVAAGAVTAHVIQRQRISGAVAPAGPHRRSAAMSSTTLPFGAVLVMSCVSGLVSLSYEIFFFRVMAYATGDSPFAFATTLGAFLVGLASGARLGSEACNSLGGGALIQRMLRSVLAATLIGFLILPLLAHLAWLQSAVLGIGLLLVYLLARQWGLVLPCLAHLGVGADAQAGMRTGLLYLANIIGAAAGSVLTGFVLMEVLSLVQLGQLLVTAALVCALILSLIARVSNDAKWRRAGAIALSGVVAVLLLPPASDKVLEALLWKGAPEGEVTFAQVVENRSGIITVDDSGTVFGNGAYDGHFNVELTNDVNGIVRPYALSLFHAAPREVLMIGLASGSWAQVVAHNPEVTALTIVEINPGYLGLVASRPEVSSLLSNRKVKFVIDDGRRWLRLNPDRRFDAIVANNTFHHRANATNLLSTDFLEILREHLNPGGIVFYNTTDSSRVQRTGCASFTHGARFTNHMVLSSTPIDWDFGRWRRTLVAYRIDGTPMLHLSRAAHAQGLARLMVLEALTRPDAARSRGDWIEPCAEVMTRTAGEIVVTDDNMGTEWRHYLNPQ